MKEMVLAAVGENTKPAKDKSVVRLWEALGVRLELEMSLGCAGEKKPYFLCYFSIFIIIYIYFLKVLSCLQQKYKCFDKPVI